MKRAHPASFIPTEHRTRRQASTHRTCSRPRPGGRGWSPRRRTAPGAGRATASLTSKHSATAAAVAAERLPVSRRSRCPARPGPPAVRALRRGRLGPASARDKAGGGARTWPRLRRGPSPAVPAGALGALWRAREGWTDGRKQGKGCIRCPGGMSAVFSHRSTALFSGRNAKLKDTSRFCVRGKPVQVWRGGSTEQLPVLSSNCALVTIGNQVMQYRLAHMGSISAC